MEKHKKIRRIVPVNRYDIAGYESWLSQMADKGLVLEDLGIFFAHFRKEGPQQLTYRLEPVASSGDKPDETVHKAYLKAGWEYVDCIKDSFAIYKTCSEKAGEIHTDFIRQSDTFLPLEKRLTNNVIFIAAINLLMVVAFMSSYLTDNEPILYMIRYNTVTGQLFYIILQTFIIIRGIIDTRHIKAYRKQLASGIGLPHEKNIGLSKRGARAEAIFILAVFIVWTGTQVYDSNQDWRKPIEEIRDLPTVSLEEIERNKDFKYISENKVGRYYDNAAQHRWSLLAPVQYEIDQRGIVEGTNWADGSGTYEPSLFTSYYEVTFKWLAKPLFNDLVKRYVYDDALALRELSPEELSAYGIEQGVIEAENEMQRLFAYKGKKVIFITYHGQEELISQLKAVAEILN